MRFIQLLRTLQFTNVAKSIYKRNQAAAQQKDVEYAPNNSQNITNPSHEDTNTGFGTTADSDRNQSHSQEPQNGRRPAIVIRNKSVHSPNLTLNVQNIIGGAELYSAAAFGTLLQVAIIVFSGVATYYPDFRSNWLKDGQPVASYAFPCYAGGTLLLVLGIFTCSYVIEDSTLERRYRPVKHEARLVWLQRTGTVSDQAFESYAIFPEMPLGFITTSQRQMTQSRSEAVQNLRKETITVLGSFTSLCGFVLQFVGLRGMHWSSSIAQLIAIGIMVGLRAWVRRHLAKPPASLRLLPGHELDWLAMILASDSPKAPWFGSQKDGDVPRRHKSPWTWKTTLVEDPQMLLGLKVDDGVDDVAPSGLDSRYVDEKFADAASSWLESSSTVSHEVTTFFPSEAHRAMKIRRDLGKSANWTGPISAQAIALARAIEITLAAITRDFKPGKSQGCGFEWYFSAGPSQPVAFRVERLGNGNWKAFSDELEAALSLWLYSVAHSEDSDHERKHDTGEQDNRTHRQTPILKNTDVGDDAWLRAAGTQARCGLKILGSWSPALHRDLHWWTPEPNQAFELMGVRTPASEVEATAF